MGHERNNQDRRDIYSDTPTTITDRKKTWKKAIAAPAIAVMALTLAGCKSDASSESLNTPSTSATPESPDPVHSTTSDTPDVDTPAHNTPTVEASAPTQLPTSAVDTTTESAEGNIDLEGFNDPEELMNELPANFKLLPRGERLYAGWSTLRLAKQHDSAFAAPKYDPNNLGLYTFNPLNYPDKESNTGQDIINQWRYVTHWSLAQRNNIYDNFDRTIDKQSANNMLSALPFYYTNADSVWPKLYTKLSDGINSPDTVNVPYFNFLPTVTREGEITDRIDREGNPIRTKDIAFTDRASEDPDVERPVRFVLTEFETPDGPQQIWQWYEDIIFSADDTSMTPPTTENR